MKTLVFIVAAILIGALLFIGEAMDHDDLSPILGCIMFGLVVAWVIATAYEAGPSVTVGRRDPAAPYRHGRSSERA